MRRVFLIAALMMSALLLTVGRTSAAGAPEYLNDGVLILSGMHQGTAWYIDKSSVRLEDEDDPIYIITFQLFAARYDIDTGEVTRVFDATPQKYKYDVENGMMFAFNYNRDYSQWEYIKPVGPTYELTLDHSGEMAWYIIYKKPFYGGRQWEDSKGQLRWPDFGEELYQRIDNSY